MSRYLVTGAGTIGSLVAGLLAGRGDEVVLVSRSGRGPDHPLVTRLALDATDADRLSEAALGAAALIDCTNPAYHRWVTDFPPLAAAALTAAERSGAVIVALSNLYAYGPPTGPMRPDDPQGSTLPKAQVRARIWQDLLAAHEAGRVRAAEVRAADFVGPHAESPLGERVVPRIRAGKPVKVLGDPDAIRSFSYTADVARTLVACADDERAWGRPWHAVTNAPLSQRQAVDDLADAAGVGHVQVGGLPPALLAVAGLFNSGIREIRKVGYQFTDDFVIDDGETRSELGLEPTPWPEVMATTVASFASPAAVPA